MSIILTNLSVQFKKQEKFWELNIEKKFFFVFDYFLIVTYNRFNEDSDIIKNLHQIFFKSFYKLKTCDI